MVVDTLKNIELYKGLSPDILCWASILVKANEDIELGTYMINSNVKAIVSSYETLDEFVRGYESHRDVIDIQYPANRVRTYKVVPN